MNEKRNTREIGKLGEAWAADYFENLGYAIIKRNFSCKTGEIDLILQDVDDTYIFVEVKTRSGVMFGSPAEAVDYRKQQHIMRTAMAFLGTDKYPMRFDVAEVFYNPGDEPSLREIRHIENAFEKR